jgi:hypothetical protein
VPRRHRVKTTLDTELEELVSGQVGGGRMLPSLVEELGLQLASSSVAVNQPRAAGEVERVLVVLGGKRVQGIARIAYEVRPLGRREEEGEEPFVSDKRADRVHPGATVAPHGSEEGEADSVLVQHAVPRVREVWAGLTEL